MQMIYSRQKRYSLILVVIGMCHIVLHSVAQHIVLHNVTRDARMMTIYSKNVCMTSKQILHILTGCLSVKNELVIRHAT